jgi:NAD(P)-dependent dehydrogenase (short-subunit alcohol dehydrogenase family)
MKFPLSGPVDLSGKVAIVTGGARGIGQATCLALARERAEVVVCDVLPVEETVLGIQKQNRKALGLACDVTSPNQVSHVVNRTMKELGRVDILVSNAGIMGKTGRPLEEITLQDWDLHLNVNLKGPFLFSQAVWPIMSRQKMGKIICIGSIAGKIGGVLAGPDYCASKGGLHAMVKCLAKRGVSEGIYVNGVAPGPIRTPMTRDEPYKDEMVPLGRLGEPQDIAEAVVFLSSPASNFITGTILDVNGGILMD